MINIQFISEEYIEGLKCLYEESFEGSKSDLEAMYRTYSKITNNPNYMLLCAIENHTVVGSVMGVLCYELFGECKPFMVVENVAVLSQYRKKGIARKLMLDLEARARRFNCSMILFVSSKHRTEAHKLYESLGYGEDAVNGYRKKL
ncbi:MAG: GNAT family N-acetyltransferase [Bacteroidales bacterium]|nr:GNAT family N-acetyltransferase [Bacteroidales bacterium]MBN2820256.1 GNAT family N-acetyltransferase [Bacteroidales bacterium]